SGPTEDGAPQTFSFSATDAGPADTLSFAILTSPSEGAVTNNGNGTFTFDPGSAFHDLRDGETRDVSFTYQANDDDGASSTPATVTITVAGVADAPHCAADHAHHHLPPRDADHGAHGHEGRMGNGHQGSSDDHENGSRHGANKSGEEALENHTPHTSNNSAHADHGAHGHEGRMGDGHHGSSDDHENGSRHGANKSGEDRSDGHGDNSVIESAWCDHAHSFVWSDVFRRSDGTDRQSTDDDHLPEKSALWDGSTGDDEVAGVPGHDHVPTMVHEVVTAAMRTDHWFL